MDIPLVCGGSGWMSTARCGRRVGRSSVLRLMWLGRLSRPLMDSGTEKLVGSAGFALLALALLASGLWEFVGNLFRSRADRVEWMPGPFGIVLAAVSMAASMWLLGQLPCIICWDELSSPWALLILGLYAGLFLLRRVVAEWLVVKGYAVDTDDVFVSAVFWLALAVITFVAAMWIVSP